MNLTWLNKVIIFVFGLLLFALAFTMAGWLFQFQGVLFIDRLFSESSAVGVLAVFAILAIGGFYLIKIGTHLMRDSVK